MSGRWTHLLVIVTVTGLIVAACAGGGTTTQPPAGSGRSAASGALTGNLEVLSKYADADVIAKTRYDTFTQIYEGDVDVTFTEADFEATAFLASVNAGNPPDVVKMGRNLLGTYAANGALAPIDQCITDRQIDMSQYREGAVATSTYDGQVYGIPEFYNTRIIYINDSVVEDAGLTAEDLDTSDWEALGAANESLLRAEGGEITRIGFDPRLPESLPLWAAANGASLLSEDGLTSNLEDPKIAEALDFAASLVLAHGDAATFTDFRTTGPGGADFFGADNQFVEDTLGAMPLELFYMNVLAEVSPDEAVMFAAFNDKQGNPITIADGSAWVIPTAADNKAAACEFMRVITTPDAWFAAAEARAEERADDGLPYTGTYTGNTVADDRIFSELVTEETAGQYYEGVQVALDGLDNAVNIPTTAAGEEFATIWQQAVQNVLQGTPAAEALTQADADAQDAIDDAQ